MGQETGETALQRGQGTWGRGDGILLCLDSLHITLPLSKSHRTVTKHGDFFFFLILFIYLFIYFWLCWVFVSVRGLSPVAASGGHSSLQCAGLSLSRPLPFRSTSSRRTGSVVVAHGLSCSAACGIFPDQGLNPCPLHWQADSQPLRHQGSPHGDFLLQETSLKKFSRPKT